MGPTSAREVVFVPHGRYWDLFECSWVDCLPLDVASQVMGGTAGRAPADAWVPAARTAPTSASAPRVPG